VAYEIEAILGPQTVLERHRDRYRSAEVVPLELGWAIIPLTFDLRRELRRVREPGVWDSTAMGQDYQRRLTAWLEEISQDDRRLRNVFLPPSGVCSDCCRAEQGRRRVRSGQSSETATGSCR
jgi:hypothetical protein